LAKDDYSECFYASRKPVEEQKKKGDREKDQNPETKPALGSLIFHFVDCLIDFERTGCQQKNQRNGKKDNNPKNQPKHRSMIMEFKMCMSHENLDLCMILSFFTWFCKSQKSIEII